MKIEKYSFGLGDRFAHQGKAQLKAIQKICEQGHAVVPVWNKSHREHKTVGSSPNQVRLEADEAVLALGWEHSYYVDADHINLSNVDLFLESSDFFTLDVTSFIGQEPSSPQAEAFRKSCGRFLGSLEVPGIDHPIEVTQATIDKVARTFLRGMQEAGAIYRHIAAARGEGNFVTEVSIDETDQPQSPMELLLILWALAENRVPVETIAPKFTGRFNKGVDYQGDLSAFSREFEENLGVIAYAVREFGLPENLKLSVHSGSDKFSIYQPIRKALDKAGAGLHIKTAGTTWLEEVIGLALAEGEGLDIAREIYAKAFSRFEELSAPYATVIDIDPKALPDPSEVAEWDGETFASTLRHDPLCGNYNPHFRQLLHVGYKVAAELGDRFVGALEEFEETIATEVTANLYERHLKRLFEG